jgi:superfamily II DNA/RNA helicase
MMRRKDSPDEEAINRLVRRQLRSPAATRLGLKLRRYQVLAALKSYEQMALGRNVVLNLPTGTGKTMVANILSLILLEKRPQARCLYLAPTRSLAYQHRHYSNWLAPQYQTILLIDESSSPERVFTLALRSSIIVSTPELCANMIRSRVIPPSVLQSLCMISVDEFDDHFVFEYTDAGPTARLDAQFQKVYSSLPKSVPVQLVSATDPKSLMKAGNTDPVVHVFSSLMDETYGPTVIDIPERLFAKHVPTAKVQSVVVNDRRVFFLAWAISVEMALTFDRIFDETGLLLSRDDVLTKLEGILAGSVNVIRLYSGPRTQLGAINKKHFYRLRDLLNHHEHLYEDMFAGFDFEVRRTKIFSLSEGRHIYTDLPRLLDHRNEKEFHAHLLSKGKAILDILNSHKKEHGVFFSRKIRLSECIHRRVTNHGWLAVQVDSRFSDRVRDQRLQDFRDGKYNLLIITRRTGRRGLDLPHAEFSVFYSPKSRETTTWQELSRIRSDVHHTKTSYFLNYGETADSRRMDHLLQSMSESGREYSFLPPTQFGAIQHQPGYDDFVSAAGLRTDEI